MSGHVNNAVEFREAPAAPIDETENRCLREMYNQLPNQNQKQNFTRKHGVKGTYQFMRLTYHKFQEQIGPDIMHSVKVAAVNMSKILNGYIKVSSIRRVEEEKRIAFNVSEMISLSKEDIGVIDGKIAKLIFPSTATGCKSSFLSDPSHLHTTHAWHEYVPKNIMMYLLRDIKQEKARRSIIFWLSMINRIEKYSVDEREIPKLKDDMQLAAALME